MDNFDSKATINPESVTIYCDGACSGNPGAGGWGAVLLWRDQKREISGGVEKTTNNRMELMAAIQSLNALKKPSYVNIYTDSTYVKNGITTWIHDWKKNGWNRGKIKNVDLWVQLDEIVAKHRVAWHWVKGHSGCQYNDAADRLARDAIKLFGR